MNRTKRFCSQVRSACFAAVLMLLALTVASCGSDHAKILPADCPGVVKVNVKSLLDKANAEERPEVKDLKEKMLDYADEHFSSSTHKRLKEMLDDPAEFGVDLREAVYIYAPSKSFRYSGFVAKVLDDDKLYDFLEMMVDEEKETGKLKEYDNCRMLVARNGEAALAFDGDVLIMAVSVDGEGRAARDLCKRFDTMGEESILDNAAFSEMDSRDDDVAACLVYENLMKVMPAAMQEEFKKVTKGTDVDGFALLAGLNFDTDNVEAWMEPYALTDEAKSQMERYAGLTQEVSGKFLSKLSKDMFLVAGMGADGSKYWAEIARNSFVKELFQREPEMAKTFESLFKSVQGEGVFALGMPGEDAREPLMTAFVDLRKTDAVESLLARLAGGNVAAEPVAADTVVVVDDVAVADDSYGGYGGDYGYGSYEYTPYQEEPQLSKDASTGYYRYCFNTYHSADTPARYALTGTKNGLFFFSNQPGFDPSASASPSLAGVDYAERIKGTVGYCVMDFRTLLKHPEVRRELERTPLASYADYLSTFEVYAGKDMKVSAKLYLKDMGKKDTALSLLVDLIAEASGL